MMRLHHGVVVVLRVMRRVGTNAKTRFHGIDMIASSTPVAIHLLYMTLSPTISKIVHTKTRFLSQQAGFVKFAMAAGASQ